MDEMMTNGMNDFSRKRFALFLTRGMSLGAWERLGMLEREIKLYQEIATSFNTVYLFTYGGKNESQYSSFFPSNVVIVVKPVFIPTTLYSFLLPFIHRRVLRTVNIMKTNQMDGSWAAVIGKKRFGAKLIVRCGYELLQFIERSHRSFLKRAFAQAAEYFAYRNADRIITTSIDAKRFMSDRFAVPSEKIALIPNFVDTERFTSLPIPKEKNRIIYVGRLEDQKNLFNLLEAVVGIDAHLVLVGEGSLRGTLAAFARERNIAVEFKGALPQAAVAIELNKSEIFVLPSLYEGHPKTLLEAMACGLACIGTDIPGINDSVAHGKNGLLCEIDAGSIRAAIKMLLADEALRLRLGEHAHAEIRARYSFERMLKDELSVYTALA